MKTLTLVRHAKSSWKDPGLTDFQRPLNKRGTHDAPLMGRVIADRFGAPELIVSSPAARARTTAEIIANAVGYAADEIVCDERVYEASIADLVEVICGLDEDSEDAFLFGHNPTFTAMIDWLAGENVGNLPTCGLARIELDVEAWEDVSYHCGRLVAFDIPKNHPPYTE